jgi:hypothetical protein
MLRYSVAAVSGTRVQRTTEVVQVFHITSHVVKNLESYISTVPAAVRLRSTAREKFWKCKYVGHNCWCTMHRKQLNWRTVPTKVYGYVRVHIYALEWYFLQADAYIGTSLEHQVENNDQQCAFAAKILPPIDDFEKLIHYNDLFCSKVATIM